MRSVPRLLGAEVIGLSRTVGEMSLLIERSARRAFLRPRKLAVHLAQVVSLGIRSLPLTIAMAIFAGMVLAFQFGYGLERFGAKLYIGQTTVTALFRELGPIMTALVVGSRIAAGISAELASMSVTEQLDAARVLGADVLQRYVAPRLLASTIALPILVMATDVIGAAGGMLIAWSQYEVSPRLFVQGASTFVTFGDFLTGVLKGFVFGGLIGVVACHAGLGAQKEARGGTEAVGRTTTRAVVRSALLTLVFDLVLTKLLVQV